MCEVLHDLMGTWAGGVAEADELASNLPLRSEAAARQWRLMLSIGPEGAWDRPAELRMSAWDLILVLAELRRHAANVLFHESESGQAESGQRHDCFLLSIRACGQILASLGYDGNDSGLPLRETGGPAGPTLAADERSALVSHLLTIATDAHDEGRGAQSTEEVCARFNDAVSLIADLGMEPDQGDVQLGLSADVLQRIFEWIEVGLGQFESRWPTRTEDVAHVCERVLLELREGRGQLDSERFSQIRSEVHA